MASASDNLEPIRGESRLGLIAASVLLGVAVVALISFAIASLWVSGLGPSIIGALIFLALAGVAFGINLRDRRKYLRDRRNGAVVIRRPWTGESLLPPG